MLAATPCIGQTFMNAKSFTGLRQIGQVRVAVQDVDRAVAFYRDILGMPFIFQFPGMAFFDLDGIRLMLVDPRSRDFGGESVIYYRVGDIGLAYAALRDRGVQFSDEPHIVHQDENHRLWMAFFRDADRNVLALMSEEPIG
jgi:catechol 2,3-dioxygenase-like lactoylglutathione lyase family enzyme